ncbi:MAG TPA: CBS and ACT domain-containing protein [Patescibacteria group bacterium]|nr:CBS and ACT domain-containing protein [Patescibacteria group bacterium]
MFVNKKMTKNPVTIPSTTTVADAFDLMRTKKFRRVPVVDNGKLVGIVTDRDLRQVTASPATSLSIFELNYLLAKMQVKEVMTKNVVTINVEATVEEAALLMSTHKIGGLVVVDTQQTVVGIITETDIFKCLIDVMGLAEGKTRISLAVLDRVGVVAEISGIFRDLGINIGSMVMYPVEGGQSELVIRADVADTQVLREKLAAAGFEIQHIVQIQPPQ